MNRVLSIAAWSVLAPETPPDVTFVPPLVRRRLSPLQKAFFALAQSVGAAAPHEVVFASRDGEDSLTRRLVEDFHLDGGVSPQRFSTSVYNAAPGLWSVFTKNRAPYTAIAAGVDSLECGLIEALTASSPSVFVYAEETAGGYGAAVRLADAGGAGRRLAVGDAPIGGQPLAFDAWVAFLTGQTHAFTGRWLAVRDIS